MFDAAVVLDARQQEQRRCPSCRAARRRRAPAPSKPASGLGRTTSRRQALPSSPGGPWSAVGDVQPRYIGHEHRALDAGSNPPGSNLWASTCSPAQAPVFLERARERSVIDSGQHRPNSDCTNRWSQRVLDDGRHLAFQPNMSSRCEIAARPDCWKATFSSHVGRVLDDALLLGAGAQAIISTSAGCGQPPAPNRHAPPAEFANMRSK